MNNAEIAHLGEWIGREERKTEPLTAALVERFEAALGAGAAYIASEVPLATHGCLTQPTVSADGPGADGHPERGGFLPPVPLLRRMWAGGELSFVARCASPTLRTSRAAAASSSS